MRDLQKATMKILLVEDELGIQQVVKIFLENQKAEVDCSDNGKEAFELVKKNDYDLILLDYNLPCWDGVETVKAISKIAKDSKIIVNTAYNLDELKTALKDFDIVVDYIAKPFNLKVLWETILRSV
jgi:DNA-binding response OmpR family regulator